MHFSTIILGGFVATCMAVPVNQTEHSYRAGLDLIDSLDIHPISTEDTNTDRTTVTEAIASNNPSFMTTDTRLGSTTTTMTSSNETTSSTLIENLHATALEVASGVNSTAFHPHYIRLGQISSGRKRMKECGRGYLLLPGRCSPELDVFYDLPTCQAAVQGCRANAARCDLEPAKGKARKARAARRAAAQACRRYGSWCDSLERYCKETCVERGCVTDGFCLSSRAVVM